MHRGIYSLGLSTNANYKSRIIELGGEYKYDFTPKKLWHVSPFVNFQVSHLKQNAYNERNLVSGTTYSGTATPSVAYSYDDSDNIASATLSDISYPTCIGMS